MKDYEIHVTTMVIKTLRMETPASARDITAMFHHAHQAWLNSRGVGDRKVDADDTYTVTAEEGYISISFEVSSEPS